MTKKSCRKGDRVREGEQGGESIGETENNIDKEKQQSRE
jgi:hypothetical protein